MGKAIDNAIEWYVGLECYTPQAKDARDVAIATMRKYQKIEQIIKDCNECELVNDYALEEIKEVVEDGNNK